jgi:hypothetical protein
MFRRKSLSNYLILILAMVLLACGTDELGTPDASAQGPAIGGAGIYGPTLKVGPCESNFVRASPGICLEINNSNALLFSALTIGASTGFQDTTVNNTVLNGKRIAIVRVKCEITQDANADNILVILYLRIATPGDQTAVNGERVCFTRSFPASDSSSDMSQVTIPLDSNGDFEWETLQSGTPANALVQGYLSGYMD